jgi:hypothetical protein
LKGFTIDATRQLHNLDFTLGPSRLVKLVNHFGNQVQQWFALGTDQQRIADRINADRKFSFKRKVSAAAIATAL